MNQNTRMKPFSVLFPVFLSQWLFAQNIAPTVVITAVTIDEVAQVVSLVYDLQDPENDLCEVWLNVSSDNGVFYETVDAALLSGDVGDDIEPGEGHSLSWDYSGLIEPISAVHVKLFASDHSVISIAEMVDQVDEEQLLVYLEEVVGERHYTAAPEHLEAVRTMISTHFEAAGLETEDHPFLYDQTDMRNVIGRKAGARNEAITYIVDGHFDGVPSSPGADDNGSAVAGMLEALRILSQYTFENSLRFIGFDAEELGLIGSLRYVQNGIKPFEDIQGVLNFEMIGYYDEEPNTQFLPAGFEMLFPDAAAAVSDDDNRGNFLTVVGNVASNPLITAFVDASQTYVPELRLVSVAVPGNGAIAPDLRRSDHSRFWDAGYQALMLTDGAEYRNLNYHTPDDVIATLDFAFMANVVKATLATAAGLAVPINAGFDERALSDHVGIVQHDHAFPATVRIYPNPSDGVLSVLMTNSKHAFRARMEVYDLAGNRVHRELGFFTSGTSGTRLHLHHLSNGPYILVLHTPEATQSVSFVMQH
jgi:hypothetical protein